MEERVLEAASLTALPDLVRTAGAEVVLMDIGGVLADDVWERMLLAPADGLAATCGLDPERVRGIGELLWQSVSRTAAREVDWWAGLEAELAVTLSASLRGELLGLVRANPEARPALQALVDAGVAVGVLSNNTDFWWPHQLRIAGVAGLVDPRLRFLSCEAGVTKSDRPGLIEHAKAAVEGRAVVVADDRAHNVRHAAGLGMTAVHVAFGTGAEGDG